LEAQPQLAASIGRTEEFLTPGFDADRLAARVGRPPMIVRLAGAMAIRRDVFDRLGGFDETLSVGEWLDWTDRFNQAGFTCAVVPEITLRRRIHPANCSSGVPPAWGDYLKVLRAALHRRHA
jgi:GT2 family glycosyltransferase